MAQGELAARWVEEKPEWFNQVFISNVDDDLFPPEVLVRQNQIGGGSRHKEFPWRQDGQRAPKKHRSSSSHRELDKCLVSLSVTREC